MFTGASLSPETSNASVDRAATKGKLVCPTVPRKLCVASSIHHPLRRSHELKPQAKRSNTRRASKRTPPTHRGLFRPRMNQGKSPRAKRILWNRALTRRCPRQGSGTSNANNGGSLASTRKRSAGRRPSCAFGYALNEYCSHVSLIGLLEQQWSVLQGGNNLFHAVHHAVFDIS